MNEHLSSISCNALVDGELLAHELTVVQAHLDECPACKSRALEHALLKNATAKVAQRYTVSPQMEERMRLLISQQTSAADSKRDALLAKSFPSLLPFAGWAVAAALLLSAVGFAYFQRTQQRAASVTLQTASLVTEVADQHIATLAAGLPPQVLSSDRHTVKPWFQGKIPFSFNLPETLPQDTRLDGADLTYLHSRPTAQLLYSIGRHRVSVFLQEKVSQAPPLATTTERAGYHVMSFSAGELEGVAVSDVDPARLAELVALLKQAQTGAR